MNPERVLSLLPHSGDRWLWPGGTAYEEARHVWNGLIERHPAAIVRCRSVADVVEGVRAARRARVPIGVRGGGHNVAGTAIVDGGIVVDLLIFGSVTVEVERRLCARRRRSSPSSSCT